MQGGNVHAKGTKTEEGKAVLLRWAWRMAALAEPFLGLLALFRAKALKAGGDLPDTAPWAWVSSPGTPVLPSWGSGQRLGVQPRVLRADGFLVSASLAPLSVVMRAAAAPCVSHSACETKPNPTAWTAPRRDHVQATPSPSASARMDSASNLFCAMGMPRALAAAGAWAQAGRRALQAGERGAGSNWQELVNELVVEGWGWRVGLSAGAGRCPCCLQRGMDLCGWRIQAGLQLLPQSEHHIHIPVEFFWHLFPSLEVAELQEGRVKREKDLTCHLSAAPAVLEEFASCPESCLSQAELS